VTSAAPKRCDKCGSILVAEQKPLTPTQAKVLEYICDRVTNGGAAPTLKEIGRVFSWKAESTAYAVVEQLARKGYTRRDSHSVRGIQVLVPHNQVLNFAVEAAHE
jgi:SOS-response transcriptional repressor LexA